jgi:hypothetical protein
MNDVNLAGLATLAFLILFLPSTGLIHRRARALATRRDRENHERHLNRLLVEEAAAALVEMERNHADASTDHATSRAGNH